MHDELLCEFGLLAICHWHIFGLSHQLAVGGLELVKAISPIGSTDAFAWAARWQVALVATTLTGHARVLRVFWDDAWNIFPILKEHAGAAVALCTCDLFCVDLAQLLLFVRGGWLATVARCRKQRRRDASKHSLLLRSRHVMHQPHYGLMTMPVTMHLLHVRHFGNI